jgi:hypothetical protein
MTAAVIDSAMGGEQEMSDVTKTAPRGVAGAESVRRKEFEWSASTNAGTINIVRTGQSSPVIIQANN